MPAYLEHRKAIRPRERAGALAAVVAVQLALGFALLSGLRVQISSPPEAVGRLIDLKLIPPPPPQLLVEQKRADRASAAPKAEPAPIGGSPGPTPAPSLPAVVPVVALPSPAPPSGGGVGAGPALGSGAGGGAGGQGHGAGEGGGTDLEQIAGDILPSDYPRRLAKAGIGGTVTMRCTVGVNGRVSRCIVIRPSGVAELDALTPRLIERRFVYRPATDRHGRPVPDDVEIEWTWD